MAVSVASDRAADKVANCVVMVVTLCERHATDDIVSRINPRSSAIPVAFARMRSSSAGKEPCVAAAENNPSAAPGGTSPGEASTPSGGSLGKRRSVEWREPSSDPSSVERLEKWLADSKGWSERGGAVSALRGVDDRWAT